MVHRSRRRCKKMSDCTTNASLHLYARCGRADAARIQLRHGADTEMRDAQGLTPLLVAARYNQLEVLQVLLQHGARTDASAPLGTDFEYGPELGTCLHFATESGHVQILKFLITAAALDADERTTGAQEMTPLHLAARLGRADIVRYLIVRPDVDINALDARGMTALHHACDYPNTHDADTTSDSPSQYLFDAAHVEVVEALAAGGAILDVRRSSDWATPLRCAMHQGHFLVAKALVDRGAYSGVAWWMHKVKMFLSTPVRTRDPARHTRTRKKYWKRRILRRDSSVWDTEIIGDTDPVGALRDLANRHEAAIHAACKSQNLRRLRDVLMGQGDAWVNSRVSSPTLDDCTGWTALHIAASSGWQAGLVLLIAHGANVELTTTENKECGTTALHLAAHNGYSSCVLTLLDAGADINACDDLGDTPVLSALRHGHSRVVKLLLRHGATCESQNVVESVEPRFDGTESILGSFDPRMTSGLHLAAFFGLLSVVRELVETSNQLFALDAVDDDGATPLWLAALMGHVEVVDFLAQQGANMHHHVGGDSASDCAAEFGHLEVVEYISASSPGRQRWGCRSLTRLAALHKTRLDRRKSV
ncbi:hypothetical protein F441_01446 [Phytophthora nicotianae CJ01A1]|uniref:Uncharacterized protein n=1 Tax=Phytophthora nicotianae CJ01A1 TaxID=1317063 RepID=W2XT97_PHYNI|nr:hypothetical protein F441_01446 [Phytophthora nicotianae CJ01A1]